MPTDGCIALTDAASRSYDAVIVPGGGLDPETGLPREWVRARLDGALRLNGCARYYIVLSRGTTHRPPPSNARGFAIDEAAASAAYLLRNGVDDPRRVLLDAWSLDTIGNAYYARQMLAAPLALRKLVLVTSAFHMPRTRAIFEWVFALPMEENGAPSDPPFVLDFCETPDDGLSTDDLETRIAKETSGLQTLMNITVPRVSSLAKLALFLHAEHGAYSAKGALDAIFPSERHDCDNMFDQSKDKLLNTY